jgi:hypothetical protein
VSALIVSGRILVFFVHALGALARLGLETVMALLRHLLAGAADNVC